MIPLAAFEQIIDASGVALRIEAMLPIGVRARQLLVRTLLLGMLLVLADHRPAHLTRVHQALTALGEDDKRRLGVIADWEHGPHLLTYRQTERTFGLVTAALGKDQPDGLPSRALQAVCDNLPEASIPDQFKDASASGRASTLNQGARCKVANAWSFGKTSTSRRLPRCSSPCAKARST